VPFRYIGTDDGAQAAEELLRQRIAQMLIRKLEPCRIEVVDSLEDTVRGTGGFGSTGL
jgi:dUTPase